MTTAADVESVLRSVPNPALRILYLAALLRQEAGLGTDDVVVVGGSAIEVYTGGAYVSGDIDICAPVGPVALTLARWGFQRPGREWARLDWKVVVDVVGPYPSGSMLHTRVEETPYGPVRLGAVEDLILGRLALIKFWKERAESANVKLLVNLPDIDWSYLADRAAKEDLSDILRSVRPHKSRLRRSTAPGGRRT